VDAGCAAGHLPQTVFVADGGPVHESVAAGVRFAGLPVHAVTERVAARIATLQTPAEVMAVFALPEPSALETLASVDGLIVYVDHLADPGNMGTLMRAAAAFAAAALISSPGSADLFSPKVVRAGVGAVFALPVYRDMTLEALLEALGERRVYGLVAHGGADLRSAALETPAIVCVGAERAGLDAEVLARLSDKLTIALDGAGDSGVESLNAGVAGAVALYEFSRRRGDGVSDIGPRRLSSAPGEE
jgi:RNA methyltransferase, TrmH family